VRANIDDWGPRSIAGHELVTGEKSRCARCHVPGGPAAELSVTRITKDEEWLLAHMADPVALAPGVRSADDPAPPPQATRFQAQAIVAYLRRTRAGSNLPELRPEDKLAATTFANMCIGCHKIAGEGGETGPDLSHIGRRRDAATIRRIIVEPSTEFGDSIMPAYGERLSEQQMDALAQYLASRR
jgi:mono/diheme cytochrome c family protein